jgi:hypothetical protein
MRTHRRKSPTRRTLLALGLLVGCGSASASAQTAPAEGVCKVTAAQAPKDEAPPAPDLTSGIRIKVLGGADGKTPIKRKRFYLLERSVREAGRQPDWSNLPRRADYLKGASPQLQEWLKKHDCDSLYCPDYEAEYAEAVKTVPEFERAYKEGLRKYRNERLALRWVTVSFPLKNVRTEYYRRKRAWLEQAAGRAGKVTSVMTDEKGEAYFTGLKIRDYYVSNLVPLEDGNVVWDCRVTVTPPVPARLHSVSVDLGMPKAAAPATAK